MGETSLVSIIIPHAGAVAPLRRCLGSVRRTTYGRHEVIAVADKPDEETVGYLNSLPGIRLLVSDELRGTEAALNQGLVASRGDYLVYLMSDVELVAPGSLEALRDTLAAYPGFGWVALSSEHTGFLAGCSMMTREAFEKLGPWDEGYVSGGGFSDDDYLRRMRKAGYEPHIIEGFRVRHHHEQGATWALLGEEEKRRRFAQNQERFRQRHGESGTDWDSLPRHKPELHRINWVINQVDLNDRGLEVGVAENPVWQGTPFNVVTVDKSVRRDEQCFPDIVAIAESLPFRNRSFDCVCINELLEHVPDPQKVLREAARVARKKVVCTVPNEHEWPPELKPFQNPGHVRFYTRESFEKELDALGVEFAIEDVRYGPWHHFGAVLSPGRPRVKQPQKVKLNLGSFVDVVPGWVNIDILPLRQHIPQDIEFKRWDLRQGIPYANESVDLIRCSHLIEHLTLEEARKLLRECHRVLRAGGLLRLSTPDIDTILKHYINSDMDFFNAIQPPEYIQAPTQGEKLSQLIFSREYEHRAVYDFEMLRSFLEQAGFRPDRIFRSVAQFSHSEEMMQAGDQHQIISIYVEGVK